MYCRNCGKEVNDKAVFCPYCGTTLQTLDEASRASAQNDPNLVGIVGFILSFFIPLAGLICSAIGFRNAIKNKVPYRNFALAGIIISSVSIALGIIASIWLQVYIHSLIKLII